MDKPTIAKDARELAINSGSDPTLRRVALMIGSGLHGDDANEAMSWLKAAGDREPSGGSMIDPLDGRGDPLTLAYLVLEEDIATGAGEQQIKTGADRVAQLAKDSGQEGLASVAATISSSISDHSYDQAGSLTALMENPPTLAPAAPVPVPPAEAAAYQQLQDDIQSGANPVVILSHAAELALAAAAAGDPGLEYVARNIGNSIGNGTYSASGSLSALKDAAPGTPGARAEPKGVPLTGTGGAYLKLEFDVAHGADPQTVRAEAEQVRSLAEKDGNTGLVAAAEAIIAGIDNGSYSQLGALNALMNNGAAPAQLRPPLSSSGSSDPDEQAAYQKLMTDIQSGADGNTIINDVLALFREAIVNGDLGLAEIALDIGEAVKAGTFDQNKALQDLTDTAPGTAAAVQLPLERMLDPLPEDA